MSRFNYEIDSKNVIRIWDLENPNEENAPFILQPNWPNGTAWASKKEAEDWTKLFILSFEDADSPLLPGDSPEEPSRSRVIPEPIAE